MLEDALEELFYQLYRPYMIITIIVLVLIFIIIIVMINNNGIRNNQINNLYDELTKQEETIDKLKEELIELRYKK